MQRWINADGVIVSNGKEMLGINQFAYCFNNPVSQCDPSGEWPQWLTDAANWVNQNVLDPIKNFFSPSTNTIGGQVANGAFRGSWSATGGYSDGNWRFNDTIKSSGSQNAWIGAFGKASLVNASAKAGIGNDSASASIKCVGDVMTAQANAGVHYKNGIGIAAAKASAFSGRATTEFQLGRWTVELGLTGHAFAIGGEIMAGYFPGEGFTLKCDAAALFGGGFIIRVVPPQ